MGVRLGHCSDIPFHHSRQLASAAEDKENSRPPVALTGVGVPLKDAGSNHRRPQSPAHRMSSSSRKESALSRPTRVLTAQLQEQPVPSKIPSHPTAAQHRHLSPTLEEPHANRLPTTEAPSLPPPSDPDLGFAVTASDGQTAEPAKLEREEILRPLDVYRRSHGLVFTLEEDALLGATAEHVRIHGPPRSGKTILGVACALAYGREDAPALIVVSNWKSRVVVRGRIGRGYKHVDVLTVCQLTQALCPASCAPSGKTPIPPTWSGRAYAAIVVDGMQNCTPALYLAIRRLITVLGNPRLIFLGDPSLDVAAFLGSDPRFFEFASAFFAGSPGSPTRQWKDVHLHRSRRISYQLAAYINHVHLGPNALTRLTGSFDAPKPWIFYTSTKVSVKGLCTRLAPLITYHKPAKSMLLTPFAKYDFVRRLLNRLTKRGIPCTTPGDRSATSGECEKLVATTFFDSRNHADKDLVIVSTSCPPEFFLPSPALGEWFQEHELATYARVIRRPANLRTPQLPPPSPPAGTIPRHRAASDIASYFDADALGTLVDKHLTVDMVSGPVEPKFRLEPRDQVRGAKFGLLEYVGAFNGLILTAALKAGRPFQVDELMQEVIEEHSQRSDSIQRKTALEGTPGTWFEDPHFSLAMQRLEAQFPNAADTVDFEVSPRPYTLNIDGQRIKISGRLDVVTESADLWEIKLVRELQPRDFFQAAVYGFLWAKQHETAFPPVFLFNVRDGSKYSISGELVRVQELITTVIRERYRVKTRKSDEDFFAEFRGLGSSVPRKCVVVHQ
ncbi:hypothetical protein C8R46DRAFT_1356470 [Mycena filopes]|nr:hypothetical protein C8R46DRAFT_1356470 [Mycena filopes]